VSAPERWGSLKELATLSGLALRTLQYMQKQEPGVLVSRQRAGRRDFDLPKCIAALLRRAQEKARSEARQEDETIVNARRRRETAEASLAETKLAQLQRGLVPLEDHLAEIDHLLTHFRAVLLAHPRTRIHAEEILEELRHRAPEELPEQTSTASAA
jgi:phage terminase Nu1 subunit (DNA packaging protein)